MISTKHRRELNECFAGITGAVTEVNKFCASVLRPTPAVPVALAISSFAKPLVDDASALCKSVVDFSHCLNKLSANYADVAGTFDEKISPLISTWAGMAAKLSTEAKRIAALVAQDLPEEAEKTALAFANKYETILAQTVLEITGVCDSLAISTENAGTLPDEEEDQTDSDDSDCCSEDFTDEDDDDDEFIESDDDDDDDENEEEEVGSKRTRSTE
jgi:hypothetical protein